MNICIDIDGTMTHPNGWVSRLNKLFNKDIKLSDCYTYNLQEVYGVSDYDWDLTSDKLLDVFLDNDMDRDYAVDIVTELSKVHDCTFVSARDNKAYIGIKTYALLRKWGLHKLPLHLLSSSYKVDIAYNLDADLFIEDSGDNALELATYGILVALIDAPYNQGVTHRNIIRVYGWDEILDVVERMQIKY